MTWRRLGRWLPAVAGALAVLFAVLSAAAHKGSDALLSLTQEGLTLALRVDLAVRDLDATLGLDADADGTVTWGEARRRRDEIVRYVTNGLALRRPEGACALSPSEALATAAHTDGTYLVLRFAVTCPSAGPLAARYDLFFDRDALHRGLLRSTSREGTATTVFTSEQRERTLALDAGTDGGFRVALREGIHHIAIGADHLLFVLALLVPVALRRRATALPIGGRAALLAVFQLVTAFTVAHSLTLALAAFDLVRLPSRLVETSIAVSIVVTALDNLRDAPAGRERWWMAFSLGLLHGFGFSSVLSDLGLASAGLARVLVGFNVGVELGQIAFVACTLPLLFALRRGPAVERRARVGLSLAIGAAGVLWAVERALDVRIFPG